MVKLVTLSDLDSADCVEPAPKNASRATTVPAASAGTMLRRFIACLPFVDRTPLV
jgi:hypothetical protein